jgi:hypothetical protein
LEISIGTTLALLSLSGFVGGYGLLGLRRWVHRWEAAYVAVFSVGLAGITAVMALDTRCGPAYFIASFLLLVAFAVPYMPFLIEVAGNGSEAMRLRVPGKEKPVNVADGVADRALDGLEFSNDWKQVSHCEESRLGVPP